MRVDGPHPGEELNRGGVTEPRQAASIVVLRDSAAGPEVLLVQRNPEQRFMGGAWVFPGGAVREQDESHAGTALRELREEAGVALASTVVGSDRDDVLNGTGQPDQIYAEGGNDRLTGFAGSDYLESGS